VSASAAKTRSKKKSEAQKLYPKKLDKKTKPTENEFEFIGRIDTINVKGSGVNSNYFQFSLIDKKGARKSYLLDPAEPLRFSTMANLLTAATGAGAKVKIRSMLNPDGSSFASELEVRIKN
jgi:hypothetical protein